MEEDIHPSPNNTSFLAKLHRRPHPSSPSLDRLSSLHLDLPHHPHQPHHQPHHHPIQLQNNHQQPPNPQSSFHHPQNTSLDPPQPHRLRVHSTHHTHQIRRPQSSCYYPLPTSQPHPPPITNTNTGTITTDPIHHHPSQVAVPRPRKLTLRPSSSSHSSIRSTTSTTPSTNTIITTRPPSSMGTSSPDLNYSPSIISSSLIPPIPSSTSTPSSTFRLLKSKLFPSLSSKHKLLPSSSSSSSDSKLNHIYGNPAAAASLTQLDHFDRSQTRLHRQQSQRRLASRLSIQPLDHPPLVPPKDFSSDHSHPSHPDSSLSSTHHNPSPYELPWNPPQPLNPLLTSQPTNRIVIDSSNRLNFPHFNNKPTTQTGPRVRRINPQLNHLPSSFLPPVNSTTSSSLERPTPIPHGGSGAIFAIHHPLNSVRSTPLPQLSNLHNPQPALNGTHTQEFSEHDRPRLPPSSDSIPSSTNPHMELAPPIQQELSHQYYRSTSNQSESVSHQADPTPASTPQTSNEAFKISYYKTPSPSNLDPSQLNPSTPNSSQATAPDGGDLHSTLNQSLITPPTPSILTLGPTTTIVSDAKSSTVKVENIPPIQNNLTVDYLSPDGSSTPAESPHVVTNSSPSSEPLSLHPPFDHQARSSLSPSPKLIRRKPPPLNSIPPLKSDSSPTGLTPQSSSSFSFPLRLSSSVAHPPKSPASINLVSPSSPTPISPATPLRSPCSSTHQTPSSTCSPDQNLKPSFSPSHTDSGWSTQTSNSILPFPTSHKSDTALTSNPSSKLDLPNTSPEIQLEKARQIILGLQNEVKQLKDASSVSQPDLPRLSSTIDPWRAASVYQGRNALPIPPSPDKHSALDPSVRETLVVIPKLDTSTHSTAQPERGSEQGAQLLDNKTEISTSNLKPTSNPALAMEKSQPESPPRAVELVLEGSESQSSFTILENPTSQGSEVSLPSLPHPSRLPIAHHRLKTMASTEFRNKSVSAMDSSSSGSHRTTKRSLLSSASTDHPYDPSESPSTYGTTRTTSPHSKAFQHQPRKVHSRQQLLSRSRIDHNQFFQDEDWSRQRQTPVQSHFPDHPGNEPNRMTAGCNSMNSRWYSGRSLPDSVDPYHGPRSSSSLSHLRGRQDSSMMSSYRPHRHFPPASLRSIYDEHDENSSASGDDLGCFDLVNHHSPREPNRPARAIAECQMGGKKSSNNSSKESDLTTMTKRELLMTIMKQRDKLDKTKAKHTSERDELLAALERSREMEAELNRERDRLLAEDAWKTDELNKAREEIGWLSRLADTLELEKSRLETRANSMANELKRAVVDLRTASSASSQLPSPLRSSSAVDNFNGRRSNNSSLSRSTRKSSYSHQSLSLLNAARNQSTESVDTICRQGSSLKIHTSKSSSNLTPKISPNTREAHSIKSSYVSAKRSVTDLRSPLSPLKMGFQRFDRHASHQQQQGFHHSGTLRSTSSGRCLSDNEDDEEAINSGGEHNLQPVTEEMDDHLNRRKSPNSGRQASRMMDHSQRVPTQPDDSEGQHDGLSRKSSSSSLAISPSSTVFADHDRKRRSRMTIDDRHSQDIDPNSQFRSSLISLQLRPEDELFLENYLENDDGIDLDDDF